MADRDPWFKFRPDYWLNDPELRSVSGRSRGALIDTMALMHYSSLYGFLMTNGHKADLNAIAKQLVWHPKTYRNAINELLEKGVLEQDEQGVIYCPKMVSDREKRNQGIEDGKKGGNPKLKPPRVNPHPVNPETDTDKETESEKNQRGKPPAKAWEEFKDKMNGVVGKSIPPEEIARSQDETATERRQQ